VSPPFPSSLIILTDLSVVFGIRYSEGYGYSPPSYGCHCLGIEQFLQVDSDFLTYKVLRLPRKSTFTTYFKLFSAFSISGVIHYAGDCAALGNLSGGALTFFIYQAAVITFEDTVIVIAAKFGITKPTPIKKVLGYFWVAAWLAYSLPIWTGPHLTGGFLEDDIQLSPIMGLSRGEWFPKPDPVNVLSTGKVH